MTQADITDDKKTFNEKKRAYSKILKRYRLKKGKPMKIIFEVYFTLSVEPIIG